MTDEEITNMLEDIISEVDYDLYKEMFLFAGDCDIHNLIQIVRRYVG